MPKPLSPPSSSGGLQSSLGSPSLQTARRDATDAQRQRERDLAEEPSDAIEGGRRKIPIRYD